MAGCWQAASSSSKNGCRGRGKRLFTPQKGALGGAPSLVAAEVGRDRSQPPFSAFGADGRGHHMKKKKKKPVGNCRQPAGRYLPPAGRHLPAAGRSLPAAGRQLPAEGRVK